MSDGRLVLVPAVNVIPVPSGVRVDTKFLSGLDMHRRNWDGPVEAVVESDANRPLPFSQVVSPGDLSVRLHLVDRLQDADLARHVRGAAVVLASGDRHDQYGLAATCRAQGVPLVYAVEYTLQTRLRTAALDPQRSALRRARSVAWLFRDEWRRRRAFGAAVALQFNGYPAAHAYGRGRVGDAALLYLDGRMDAGLMATGEEMAVRRARLDAGHPLRLVTSGRLEPMKGAQDLVPFACALRAAGRAFTLDIFGAGSLAVPIAAELARNGLTGQVRLHRPVGFDDELVPFMRQQADIFLSCHRQGDPSCSYLEAMGCGLPIMGTDNEMWRQMCRHSGAGWTVRAGRPDEMARAVAALDGRDIATAGESGLRFARAHAFNAEFSRRMDHLRRVARAGAA